MGGGVLSVDSYYFKIKATCLEDIPSWDKICDTERKKGDREEQNNGQWRRNQSITK